MIQEFQTLARRKLPFLAPLVGTVRHWLSKRKIRRLLGTQSEICIEVGAGDKSGVGEWLTIDVTRSCDIYWNLRKGIPFPNERINKIYSSHFLEHLAFGDIQNFLDECKRVLVAGGKFLICVPNARIYIEAYSKGTYLEPTTFFGYERAYNQTTRIDYVNYTAYMAGQHKYMFDEDNLIFILKAKGFRNVRLRRFDPNLDLKERDFESIYAEAEK
jgi:predicted SAM-dependent methyltransferase